MSLPGKLWGLESGHQPWQQAPLPYLVPVPCTVLPDYREPQCWGAVVKILSPQKGASLHKSTSCLWICLF